MVKNNKADFQVNIEAESSEIQPEVKYSVTGEPKTKCPECDAWKPAQYELCWNCWAKKPQNTVKPKSQS